MADIAPYRSTFINFFMWWYFYKGYAKITRDDVDPNTIYTINIVDCNFVIDLDVIADGYPILVIPGDQFDPSNMVFNATKIY